MRRGREWGAPGPAARFLLRLRTVQRAQRERRRSVRQGAPPQQCANVLCCVTTDLSREEWLTALRRGRSSQGSSRPIGISTQKDHAAASGGREREEGDRRGREERDESG
ncbi:hypothetical protein U9M48_044558 [Paspalum notatum var. saurae]|uniref:Uncharacterized protein n=1 Tax=Paspalum notatum var. saurae TaxID=547442 RepID=A0AAQ3UX54_PASNO